MEPIISVVIACGREDISRCLKSLENQSLPPNQFEVLVVDHRLESVRLEKNIHFLKVDSYKPTIKRNFGVQSSCGKFIAFIDDDAVAPRDWLRTAIQTLEQKQADFAGGPNMGLPDQPWRQYLSDLIFRSVLGTANRKKYVQGKAGLSTPIDFAFCNLIFRKEIFQRLGGLNPNMGYGGEDVEFLHRAWLLGYRKFYYDPSLFVWHQRRNFPLGHMKQVFTWGRNKTKVAFCHPTYWRFADFTLPLILIAVGLIFFWTKPQLFLILSLILLSIVLLILLASEGIKRGMLLLPLLAFHYASYGTGVMLASLEILYHSFKSVTSLRAGLLQIYHRDTETRREQ